MSKISNCFKLLEILSSGRKYSTKELSELLEVNARMIRYYIEELEKSGIYVASIKGKYGGYYLNYDYVLPVRGLSKDEMTLLEQNQNIDTKEIIKKLKEMNETKIITKELEEVYNKLSIGIKNKNKIRIIYTSSKGSVRTRVIHPEALYNNHNTWYVSAYCEYKQAIRRFRLKSISKIEVLEETF